MNERKGTETVKTKSSQHVAIDIDRKNNLEATFLFHNTEMTDE